MRNIKHCCCNTFLYSYTDLDSDGLALPEAHPDREFPEGGPAAAAARLNDSILSEEPASEYEALVLKWVADYVNTAQVQSSIFIHFLCLVLGTLEGSHNGKMSSCSSFYYTTLLPCCPLSLGV